ncbi:MAG: WD40/YVTN/BNR-like repeat-containing protein, partial [Bacteroidota bacterium]
LYHCSQFVHKSVNGGQSWEVISPDLTLNRKELQGLPGGPVQIDYTGVENFNTIFVLEESLLVQGELWAGTDDGLVHLTTDGGKSWKKITPPGIPELATVNSIDISKHRKGVAYVTAHNYRLNDFKPYVFKTENYGATWTSITAGIPDDWFVRVVREDPAREGLLYCGTEFGMFISPDGGKQWSTFQLNLPRTPVTDLLIKDDDLVMSTQGRSFWILDDLTALREWSAANASSSNFFTPQPAYRTQLSGWGSGIPAPAPKGAVFQFMLDAKPDSANVFRLEIADAAGRVKKVFSGKPDAAKHETEFKAVKGFNRLTWDLEFPGPEITPGSIMGYGWAPGPQAAPGVYTATLSFGKNTLTQKLTVTKDPRWSASEQDLQQQFELSLRCQEQLTRVHRGIRQIRNVRTQVVTLTERAEKSGKGAAIRPLADKITAELTALENKLIQTKNKAGQDPINYPPMFDEQWNWLCMLVENQDALPTAGCYDLFNDLKNQSDVHMSQLDRILQTEVKIFNDTVAKENLSGVTVEGGK